MGPGLAPGPTPATASVCGFLKHAVPRQGRPACLLMRGALYCAGAGAFLGAERYPEIWFFDLMEFTTISYSAGSLPL